MGEPAMKMDEHYTYRDYRNWPERPDQPMDEADTVTQPDRTYGLPKVKSLKDGIPVNIFPGLELKVTPEDLL